MVSVKREQLVFLQKLSDQRDNARSTLAKGILVVYGAISSGLFLLVSGEKFIVYGFTRCAFVVFVFTSLVIAITAILEPFFDYVAKDQRGNHYANELRNGNVTQYQRFGPHKIVSTVLTLIPWVLFITILINIISAFAYILIRIY